MDITSGNYPIINPQNIKNSVQRIMKRTGINIHQYSSPKGLKELRVFLANELSKYFNLSITPSNFLITTGSQQSIQLLMDLLEVKKIIMEEPTYYKAIDVMKQRKIKMIPVAISEKGIDLARLQTLLKKEKVHCIYVVPTFNNPTGYAWPISNRIQFLKIINKYSITVIEDDPYSKISFTNQKYPSLYELNKGKNVIYLGTFSKIISPSISVGYILAEKEIIDKLYLLKENYDLGTSLWTQYVVLDYLKHYDMDEELNQRIPIYLANIEKITKLLEEKYKEDICISKAKGGLFLLVEFKNHRIPEEFMDSKNYFIRKQKNIYIRINISNI